MAALAAIDEKALASRAPASGENTTRRIKKLMVEEYGSREIANLPDDIVKDRVLGGMNMLKLSARLNQKAAQLSYEAITEISTALAGLDAGAFVDFLENEFGVDPAGEEGYETAHYEEEVSPTQEAAALASSQSVPSSLASSDVEAYMKKYTVPVLYTTAELRQRVKSATKVYPVSKETISMTDVPDHMAPCRKEARGQSVYHCVACPYSIQNKSAAFQHVRVSHLNTALACPYCPQTTPWWSEKSWVKHMTELHPTVPHFIPEVPGIIASLVTPSASSDEPPAKRARPAPTATVASNPDPKPEEEFDIDIKPEPLDE